MSAEIIVLRLVHVLCGMLWVGAMVFIGRQYRRRRLETEVRPGVIIGPPRRRQRVLVPVSDVTRDVVQAIKFGRTMSDDVTAVLTAFPDQAVAWVPGHRRSAKITEPDDLALLRAWVDE